DRSPPERGDPRLSPPCPLHLRARRPHPCAQPRRGPLPGVWSGCAADRSVLPGAAPGLHPLERPGRLYPDPDRPSGRSPRIRARPRRQPRPRRHRRGVDLRLQRPDRGRPGPSRGGERRRDLPGGGRPQGHPVPRRRGAAPRGGAREPRPHRPDSRVRPARVLAGRWLHQGPRLARKPGQRQEPQPRASRPRGCDGRKRHGRARLQPRLHHRRRRLREAPRGSRHRRGDDRLLLHDAGGAESFAPHRRRGLHLPGGVRAQEPLHRPHRGEHLEPRRGALHRLRHPGPRGVHPVRPSAAVGAAGGGPGPHAAHATHHHHRHPRVAQGGAAVDPGRGARRRRVAHAGDLPPCPAACHPWHHDRHDHRHGPCPGRDRSPSPHRHGGLRGLQLPRRRGGGLHLPELRDASADLRMGQARRPGLLRTGLGRDHRAPGLPADNEPDGRAGAPPLRTPLV
ncbi:MAG: Phosphate transport system permease protein PstA, partial [uncultured Rubellimicrobium sp.]